MQQSMASELFFLKYTVELIGSNNVSSVIPQSVYIFVNHIKQAMLRPFRCFNQDPSSQMFILLFTVKCFVYES